MKYKIWQILKIIAAGALPIFFSIGSMIIVFPLSAPTYLIVEDNFVNAMLAICFFLYPILALLILEHIWMPMGENLKSKEITNPFVATMLASIIPAYFVIKGVFFAEAASNSMLFSVFRTTSEDVTQLLGIRMYSKLMPCNGYVAFLAVIAVVFYLGFIKAPMKEIFKTWYICIIPCCIYNAIWSVKENISPEMLSVIEPLYVPLVLACRLAWPAMVIILIRQIMIVLRQKNGK